MNSFYLVYMLAGATCGVLAGAAGFLLVGLLIAAAVSFVRQRRRTQEIFPIPFFGRWVKLGVLQQYVLSETFWPVVLSVLALTFFLLADKIYELIDLLMANWSVSMVTQVIMSLLPIIFALTVPIAILVGVLLGIGRMAVGNEIRACQTAGVHLLRIFFPLMVFCALVSLAMILVNYEYSPRMMKRMRNLKNRLAYEAVRSIPAGIEYEIESNDGSDVMLFYSRRDDESGDMMQVRMMLERKLDAQESKEAQKAEEEIDAATTSPASREVQKEDSEEALQPIERQIIVAARARILYDEGKDTLRFNFENGFLHSQSSVLGGEITPGKESFGIGSFSDFSKTLAPKKDKKPPAEYRMLEIVTALIQGRDFKDWRKYRNDNEGYLKQRSKFKVDLAERTAIPLSCIAFALLGIPLAIFARPSGKSIGIAIAFLLVMLYYWMLKWGSGLAEEGNDLGLLIIFLPNVLMAGLGVILFRRAVRL